MMASSAEARQAEVWARLARVNDPELDDPITDMGFVERVTVSAAGVIEVEFRLPTYWCSPNFAFLMAEGIIREAGSLPWAAGVRVQLQDHMWGEEINDGLNAGRSFGEIFGALADGEDLGELRAKFETKAFQRRQEEVSWVCASAAMVMPTSRPWTCAAWMRPISATARPRASGRATASCC